MSGSDSVEVGLSTLFRGFLDGARRKLVNPARQTNRSQQIAKEVFQAKSGTKTKTQVKKKAVQNLARKRASRKLKPVQRFSIKSFGPDSQWGLAIDEEGPESNAGTHPEKIKKVKQRCTTPAARPRKIKKVQQHPLTNQESKAAHSFRPTANLPSLTSEGNGFVFHVGTPVAVWWQGGQKWDGLVRHLLAEDQAVVVSFLPPYDRRECDEVFCINGSSIAPRGKLHLVERLSRAKRLVLDKRKAELSEKWKTMPHELAVATPHPTPESPDSPSRPKDSEADSVSGRESPQMSQTDAEKIHPGVVNSPCARGCITEGDEDIVGVRWHPSVGFWSAEIQLYGNPAHLGYFSNKQKACEAHLQAGLRSCTACYDGGLAHHEFCDSSYNQLLTARYLHFEVHHREARQMGDIEVRGNGRVFVSDVEVYKCAGGRRKAGRYGEMLPPFVHIMVLTLAKRLGRERLGRSKIYDLGSGIGNVAAQLTYEIDGCEVIGIENAKSLVETAHRYMMRLTLLHASMFQNQKCKFSARDPMRRCEFFYGDFFKQNLSDADVIIANNLAFPDIVNQRLLLKIAQETRPGTLIILTHDLPYVNRMSPACINDGRAQSFARRHPNNPALWFNWGCITPSDVNHRVSHDPPDLNGVDENCLLFTDTLATLEQRQWVSWGSGSPRAFFIYERRSEPFKQNNTFTTS